MNDLLLASGLELASHIRSGRHSAREVLDAHLDHARRINPGLRAIVVPAFEEAQERADDIDRDLADPSLDRTTLPALLGVPCTIKEAFAQRGKPWTGGLLAREGTLAPRDAVTVQRLKQAGAVVMGQTNLSELCMWYESDNPVYGRTQNPYDPTRIAGGSSGGEGAIIGSGASVFGLGADVGGSIRLPAFFCGVFGHKPTPGVVPNTDQFPLTGSPEASRLLATGPLARRAADLWPLLSVLAGPDGTDPICEAHKLQDPADVLLEGMTVLDVRGNGIVAVERSLQRAQAAAATHLSNMGCRVQQRAFSSTRRSLEFWALALSIGEEPGQFRSLMGKPRRRQLLKSLLRPSELGGAHTLPAIVLGLIEDLLPLSEAAKRLRLADLDDFRAQLVDQMNGGIMLFPSYPRTAPRHREPWLRPLGFSYTALFNALGFPVTQVPLGLDEAGLPMGVQVVAAPDGDARTLAAAMELEREFGGWTPPWGTRPDLVEAQRV